MSPPGFLSSMQHRRSYKRQDCYKRQADPLSEAAKSFHGINRWWKNTDPYVRGDVLWLFQACVPAPCPDLMR